MNKAHSPINWENYPNETTPINESNLNKMDRAIGIIDDRVIEQENKKLSKSDASSDIVNVEYDKDTSVFQFTKRNGETVKVDVSSVVVKEGYTKEESDQRYANAIKVTHSGETIVARDSSGVHLEGLRVLGRSEQASTKGYQLFDINANKSISNKTYMYEFTLKPNTPYTLSTNAPVTKVASLYLNGGSSNGNQVNVNIPRTITTDDTGYFFVYVRWGIDEGTDTINLYDAVLDGTYWIMLNEGDTPLPYEPFTNGPSPNPEYPQPIESVGDDGNIDVGVYGKNLFDMSQLLNASGWMESNGVYFGDIRNLYLAFGSNGKTFDTPPFLENKRYTVSFLGYSTDVNAKAVIGFMYADGTKSAVRINSTNEKVFTLTSEEGKVISGLYASYHVSGYTTYLRNIQLELGTEATSYEPYRPKQSLTIQTPNGLPGIKVTDASLATYTDSDGVMWSADEVDFARGKYVQRIGRITLNGTEPWFAYDNVNTAFGIGSSRDYPMLDNVIYVDTSKYNIYGKCNYFIYTTYVEASKMQTGTFCSYTGKTGKTLCFKCDNITNLEDWKSFVAQKYADGNPLEIIFRIEPLETDLTAEQLEAYKTLHSNYPTTTILNDENAHMEAVLVTDTKNHIAQNYVQKSEFLSVVERVSALEQRALE